MRQRRLIDLDERKERLSKWFLDEPENLKGNWKNFFKENGGNPDGPIYLEIGCGKGKFITDYARNNPDKNYIALEGQESVIVRAMDKAEDYDLKNIAFLSLFMTDICDYFDDNEIDGIYLNFSDPWPKARHAKRRLTYHKFLEKYKKIIKAGGFIEFKTDNDNLFDFTLEEIESLGYKIEACSRDLHHSRYKEGNITTEYEEKFAGRGKNINYVKIGFGGSYMILAQENNRVIPKEDKIFALNNMAKKMIAEQGKDAVINATIGALLLDNGELAVMKSVIECIKELGDCDFAEYASIGGIPEFKEAIIKAAFHEHVPAGYIEAVATPGGTGGIRNVIANYSKPGDRILTCDWYWAPYNTICQEQGRTLDTYELFNEHRTFNIEGFKEKVFEIAADQKRVVILLNTPAHNPTGYALEDDEWDAVIEVLNDDKLKDVPVALFIDVAYIDFAGDPEDVRSFVPKLENLKENVLPVMGYSASKTFTAYGMRTGAMICIAKTKEIAKEFRTVCEFSARNTWSNGNRSGQQVIANIYKDEKKLAQVEEERAKFRNMLLERGRVFDKAAEEAGLETVPFDSGFFVCVACDNPNELCDKLVHQGIFVVPLVKGVRISIASINKEECVKVAQTIADILK